jgi:hypothetical protein
MDDEDGKHLADTIRILQQVQGREARTNADASRPRPAPRSPLRGDDDKAHPYDLSNESWRHLSTAVDHLSCLRAVLEDAKVVHMYAPFTLVRGALENACGAVWLLQPLQRTERLARGLRLALADVRHSEDVKQLTGNAGPRTRQARIDQINDIAKRAGLDAAALKGSAGYSEIVKAVDQNGPANNTIEVRWKLCSAYAHGDMWSTLGASQRTPIPDTGTRPGVGAFKIQANVSLLMHVTALAVNTTRRGWQLYDQRCLSPY